MSDSKLTHNEINYVLKKSGASSNSTINILEIGPGRSDHYLKNYTYGAAKINLTLIDAFPEGLSQNIPHHIKVVIKKGVAPADLNMFKADEFDLVICKHVIEHLDKSSGYLLLYEIDRIAKYSSMVTTPMGFVWQVPGNDNPYNAHLSGWTPSELKRLNWNSIYGQTGPKYFFGPGAEPIVMNRGLLRILGFLYPVFQRFPNMCFAFTAIKREKNYRTNFLGK